jgi:hypothetical protein
MSCGKFAGMNTGWIRLWLGVLLGAGGWAGCASPEARHEADPDVFRRLTPAQQALVKAGRVAVGFDADTVRLALGEPDRITTRTDAAGDVQVWHYTTYEANGVILFTGTYQSYRRHGFGWEGYWGTPYPYYLDYPDRVIHDRFSVELVDDRVTAIIPEPR